MSPSSKPFEEAAEDDGDMNALDDLLAAVEAEEAKAAAAPPTIAAAVPKLREDSTFAEAFSYDIDTATAAKASASIKDVVAEEMDSSDDDEVKNFLERKYNEYGRDINKKLKQQNDAKHEAAVAKEVSKAIKASATPAPLKNPHNPVERKSHGPAQPPRVLKPENTTNQQNVMTNYWKPAEPKSTVFTDPVFGLRLINPLISSTGLVDRMAGKKPIPFNTLAFHTERGDLSKDWVIAGVLINKSPVKTTKTGAPFSIWKLSDLKGEVKVVSLFLFRNAHKQLWKTATGMAVAILNPSVLDKRAERGDVACLSIDTDSKVMILGQSKDLGTCKAKKKNGEPCTATINLGECDYCIFHMKQEYSKMSQRSELQSNTAGRGLNELRNKVLGKSEVFYGGQSYTAVPAKKSAKLAAKDSKTLMSLSEYAVSPNAAGVNHTSASKQVKAIPYASRGGPVSKMASNVEANTKQRLKDIERLKMLKEEAERFSQPSAATPSTSVAPATSSLKATTPTSTPATPTSVPEKFQNRQFSFASGSPQLSRENFCIEVTVADKQAKLAKLKAMQVLKNKPIQKVDPNFVKYRGTTDGKRRAIDELNDKFSTESKRQKLNEDQREVDRKTRIQRIMEASSSHTNLIDCREMQEQEKYFSKLEKKEALEEKMLNTFKVPCKAVICLKCKYTAFSAADQCKEVRHPLKVVDAEKRFFQCEDCGNRTTTVHKLPKMSCKNCQGSRWRRSAMIRERKIDDGREQLSIRGDEEVFLGSVASKANLNLLVPE